MNKSLRFKLANPITFETTDKIEIRLKDGSWNTSIANSNNQAYIIARYM